MENTTRVSVCLQTQYLLCKRPLFKVNLHTSEDQKHSVQYLHSVKNSKMSRAWYEPYIVCFVTDLNNYSK